MFGRNKNVLISGGTGFLGSHVSKLLLDMGFEVHILKRRTSSLKRLDDITDRVTLINVDDFTSNNSYDYFFHIATCYGRNGETRDEIEYSNVKWPIEIIEKLGDKTKVINFGTSLDSKVNSYAETKNRFIDLVREQFSNPITNLELEHFFGPDDGKFINYLINSFKKNVESIELTRGEQIRDFIYYKDLLLALRVIIESNTFGDIPVGSGNEYLLKSLITEIKEIMGNTKTDLEWGAVPYRENEVMFSVANIDKLKQLGWRPTYKFKEGVVEIINNK